jgi:hypothetical protein
MRVATRDALRRRFGERHGPRRYRENAAKSRVIPRIGGEVRFGAIVRTVGKRETTVSFCASHKLLSAPLVRFLRDFFATKCPMTGEEDAASGVDEPSPTPYHFVEIDAERRQYRSPEDPEHSVSHEGYFIVDDDAHRTGRMPRSRKDEGVEPEKGQVKTILDKIVCRSRRVLHVT